MKTKILIDPRLLTISGKPCVTAEALKILGDKKIRLELDVWESEPETNTKPTMIFVHGNSSSKRAFDHLVKRFTDRYRVIAYDLLGHGDSTKIGSLQNLQTNEIDVLCSNLYNPCAMIAQAIQLLNTLKVSQAHVLAWSLAGHIFYGVGSEQPNLIASLTTIGSPPVFFKRSAFKEGFHDFFTETLLPAWIKEPKHYNNSEASQIALSVGFPANDLPSVEDLMNTDPLVRKFLFVTEDSNTVLDAMAFISNATIPICLMVGDKDVGIKFEYLVGCKSKLKHAFSNIEIIPNAPHALFISNAEDFLKVFNAFLMSCRLNSVVKTLETSSNPTEKNKKNAAENLHQFKNSQQPTVNNTAVSTSGPNVAQPILHPPTTATSTAIIITGTPSK